MQSESETDWIEIRPDILSGVIWVQTVCKSYQQTTLVVNPYPANIFGLKKLSAYYICGKNSNAIKTTSIMQANTKNPDQIALKRAV